MNVQVSCDVQLCCVSPDVSKDFVLLPSGWSNQWIEPSILLCLNHTVNKTLRFGVFNLNMNLLLSDETSTYNHSTTQCHIPEDFYYENYPTSSATLKWTSVKIKRKICNFFCGQLWMFRLLLQSRGTFSCACARGR